MVTTFPRSYLLNSVEVQMISSRNRGTQLFLAQPNKRTAQCACTCSSAAVLARCGPLAILWSTEDSSDPGRRDKRSKQETAWGHAPPYPAACQQCSPALRPVLHLLSPSQSSNGRHAGGREPSPQEYKANNRPRM
eukprot:scaffold30639_cov17-Tisochrysis_lutea.AAC.1